MNNNSNQPAKKKRKDLKAATHILKREALRRYREKLHRQFVADENFQTGSRDQSRDVAVKPSSEEAYSLDPLYKKSEFNDMEEDNQSADQPLVKDEDPSASKEEVEAERDEESAPQDEKPVDTKSDSPENVGLAEQSREDLNVVDAEPGKSESAQPVVAADPESVLDAESKNETEDVNDKPVEEAPEGVEEVSKSAEEVAGDAEKVEESLETSAGNVEEAAGIAEDVKGDETEDVKGTEDVKEVSKGAEEVTEDAKEVVDGSEESPGGVELGAGGAEEVLDDAKESGGASAVIDDAESASKSLEQTEEQKDLQQPADSEPAAASEAAEGEETVENKEEDGEQSGAADDNLPKEDTDDASKQAEVAEESNVEKAEEANAGDESRADATDDTATAEAPIEPQISYDVEAYQSKPRVSDDSGIPFNILHFFHSFGYDCRKRSNLYLLQGPTALFAAGNYVHLLDLVNDEHRFLRTFSGGGVGALTVHPSGEYFAVAEKGDKPNIMIYCFPSLTLHRMLRGGTEKAYSFVDFSPKGDLLASVGSAPDYMLTVWDWNKENIMLRSKAFSQEVYRVTFSPEQEGQLTSCGTTHIRFWKMAWTFTGLKLKGELGRFGKTALGDIDGYIQLPDGKVLSGSDWGNMLLWDGGLIKVEISRKNQKPCHVGSIQQLVMDEGELITIGKDGYVRVWEMEAIDTADVTDESDVFEVEPMNELRVGHDVQLVCMVKAPPEEEKEGEETSSIWFAQDANGGIWKLDLSFSHTTKPPEKLYSYTAGPISGISCSPVSHLMAASGDTYIRIYDYLSQKLLCQYATPTPHAHSTFVVWPNQVVDPKGTTIISGFSDGIIRVLLLQQIDDVNELTLKQAWKPHSSLVTAMAFDNVGQVLATGSSDRTVFFFHVDGDQYEPIGFVKVPGEVTGLQWSPAGFSSSTLLVSCHNGKVVEVPSPSQLETDTSHSYHLQDVQMKYFTFQSVKSELRRNEERERKEKAKALRRKKREKELQRRKDAGEEISPEDAQAFLDDDPEAAEEKEEEPLFIPPEPNSVLHAFYLEPGKFVVSMDGYDAGYLYECCLPDEATLSDPNQPSRPVQAVTVEGSRDVPITRMIFTSDRRKFICGFKNGMLRVYPLESDPETDFDLSMLGAYWEFNMHDNDTGQVTNISESHDGAHLFSGGDDGNLFGYLSLAHDQIIKSMEGKRAKLPTPKKASSSQLSVDDIDDPHAYSIEDAKLKAEHDKMMREAEAKKTLERKKIQRLRRTFHDLQHKNNKLPSTVQLQKEDFELDPSLRHNMAKETGDRIERVRLEMQWDKAKLALLHEKLKGRFRSRLECERIVVHSFKSNHTVASFRLEQLSEEFHQLRHTIGESIRANSLSSESGTVGMQDRTSLISDRTKESNESALEDEEPYLRDQNQKQKATILHGRQAEKVQKALQKAAEARERREKREQEWEELLRNKPDENYEDPADVAAIREAQAHMGDFKLKTAPDYVVPEHLRMDTEKKRFQILTLQGMRQISKSQFNEKLVKLRDEKFAIIEEVKGYVEELKKMQKNLAEVDRLPIPSVPRPHPEEEPHKKFEYTKESLLQFEEDEKKRETEAAMKKRAGDGGLFGGFGGNSGAAPSTTDARVLSRQSKKTLSVASSGLSRASRSKVADQDVAPPSSLEIQLSQIDVIRSRYHRDRLLRLIHEKITLFDSELRLLRQHKTKLDVNLKMADLREVTLVEELLLLKEYEKREKTLSGRVAGKKNELTDILGKASEMQVKLEAKRRDIERLSDREKALYASFTMSLGENNKFADFLNKVFKKKIKRAKKKVAAEGEEEDSDMTSSDESDWSSDEDDDGSLEGGFDDSVCPPGCDQQLFDSAIALREKRLDLEEALMEEKKAAETLKKDADSYSKKAKVMESQLKTALADLEAFQVEKQGKLNELDVVVPLRLHQVEHVYNGIVPNDLSPCLVFTNPSLTSLQRRIKELQQEKNEQRKFYKEARQQHVHLIKNRRIMEERINLLEEKCEQMMMLKFGRVVDLDKVDSVTINKTVEELKEKVRRNELRNSHELSRKQRHIERLKERMTDLIRENTKRLETLNVLVTDKEDLELTLNKRQKNLELDDPSKQKAEMREQHRLVQLVQLQAQEIQALKEEIGLLSRKGGHILPPAQPPLGQEHDAM